MKEKNKGGKNQEDEERGGGICTVCGREKNPNFNSKMGIIEKQVLPLCHIYVRNRSLEKR